MNLLFLLLWFAVCADQDARCRKVSNWLTLGGGLFALVWLLMVGNSWLGAPAQQAWWALLLTLIMTLPGYALNRLGAGDVKLLVALALTTDALHILGTFIGAGVASVIWLVARQKVWRHVSQRLRRRYPNLAPETSSKQPFVPFLLVGFIATVAFFH
jgi:prepilin peptidase CpaA